MDVKGVQLALREETSRDRAFIASRWVRSYSAERAGVSPSSYRRRWNALVDMLLRRSRVVVACSPREPSAVLGFAAVEGDVLHYVYVLPEFQQGGLCRALVTRALGAYPTRDERAICTHEWPYRTERYRHDWFPLTGAERSIDNGEE